MTVLSLAHPISLSSLLKTPFKPPSFPQNHDFWVYIVRHLLEPGHLLLILKCQLEIGRGTGVYTIENISSLFC